MQITPWSSSRDLVALGRGSPRAFDVVWVQDQMLARNAYTLARRRSRQAGCGVGTGVTYPIGRNPIEMASAAATVGEAGRADDREMVLGMGTGGALVSSLFRRDKAVTAVAEAIRLMRGLWRGDERRARRRSRRSARALGYRPGAVAKLTYPVRTPPASIVVAGVGPKILPSRASSRTA